MKNMHLLPTEKPSRLYKLNVKNEFFLHPSPIQKDFYMKSALGQHIYITSDEEIKEGDYVVQINFEKTNTQVIKCETEFQTKIANSKDGSFSKNKIILTTDQDLINDGVQEINDGFLEWFVKNPNCNFVRAIKVPYFDESSYSYVLIIPLEEDFELVSIGEETVKLPIPMIQDKEEIKQETLEEAAMNYLDRTYNLSYERTTWQKLHEKTFIAGAKWQQEQDKNLYSEEEVLNIILKYELAKRNKGIYWSDRAVKEWFEQFKK